MTPNLPCAIYTRKSSEEGLEQEFNSLDAQREACEAYILSQKAQGWRPIKNTYDDGGFSGGNIERPGLTQLLKDIRAKRIRIVVVYKVDRLSRSLADFAKLIELFDAHEVSFVSVTQQFNTTNSMGRLTLNVLLSFAQFEREVTGERIRDKIAASKKKGMWMGGNPPLGYIPHERSLAIDEIHAERVREIFKLYLEVGTIPELKRNLDKRGWVSPQRTSRRDHVVGGRPFSRGNLRTLLQNPIYQGRIVHKGAVYDGQHPAIIDATLWQAVQDKLASHLKRHHNREYAAAPMLLAGRVFDSLGNKFGADHANNHGKRYRYYVSPSSANESDASTPAIRIPADELESVVVDAIVTLLQDEDRLVQQGGELNSHNQLAIVAASRVTAQRLMEGVPSAQIDALRDVLERVTIESDHIQIALRILGTPPKNEPRDKASPLTLIDIPVKLRRSGKVFRMVIPAKSVSVQRGPDPKVGALIAKAHDWFGRLISGRYDGVQAIAREVGVTSSYATRVIYLAMMAPDLSLRLLSGEHPRELTSVKLLSLMPLPEVWDEQRRLLGMAG